MTFTLLDQKKKVAQREKEILTYWEENMIFEKSVTQRSKKEIYTFYDGPPFATGLPHYGHIIGQTIKDIVPRYWAMNGKRVERKWGWDCHGLPIENIVEKELGSKGKEDIEEMGVAKFNEMCRTKVLAYADEWEQIIPRLGRWVDMKNAYRTMDRDFMESVWWVFKTIYDKDLVYEDYRSMHVCPRCETTLSQSEVSEGYMDIKDLSVVAKFKLTAGQKIAGAEIDENTFILAWTTTPWTLPGNVALAVGEEIDYVKVVIKNEGTDHHEIELSDEKGVKKYTVVDNGTYILSREYFLRQPNLYIPSLIKDNQFDNYTKDGEKIQWDKCTSIKKIKGSSLVGLSYESLYNAYSKDATLKNQENGWRVYAADFVTTDDGTGVVHIAPAFGEDDMTLGKEHSLPWVQHVAMNGVIADAVGAPLAGLHVKPIANHQETDIEVIKDLAHRGLLFHKEKFEHSYPHCWRCDTPLLNYATSSWFVSVTKIKKDLLKNAQEVNWSPEHMKDGRFGKWLDGARDWSISRQRFWASVIPVWRCSAHCGAEDVFGSVEALEKKVGVKIDDLHKHVVDDLMYDCTVCDGTMRRIPDVLDTWFDSGSMPYAQMHYPFENEKKFEEGFPADFIAEGVDQTRCWFYYLHVLAGGVMGRNAFENVIVNGVVLAEDGKKMAKKLQNYPDPMTIVEKHGADALRLYLTSSPVVAAENLNFSEKDLTEVSRGLMRMLTQSHGFFLMYASVDQWEAPTKYVASEHMLDRWIVSELHTLLGAVNRDMTSYNLQKATRAFGPFVDDLSNWYIRRSRKRFWKSEDDNDKNAAYATLHYVLVTFAKVIAPFAPFIAEEIYRSLTDGESVHLEDYPQMDANLVDEELMQNMRNVRSIITDALQLRAKAQIKVRQPLSTLKVKSQKLEEIDEIQKKELIAIIKEELNIKNVLFDDTIEDVIWIDITLTPELKREGQAREIIRHIQKMRKEADYQIDDRITVGYTGMEKVFDEYREIISKEVLATNVVHGDLKQNDLTKTVQIDGEEVVLFLSKN